jgi:hypothetical protein
MATRVPCGSSNGSDSVNRARPAARWPLLVLLSLVVASPAFAGRHLRPTTPTRGAMVSGKQVSPQRWLSQPGLIPRRRPSTVSHWMFAKNASMYLAAAAP